jgi:predicted site-specific integrase-resolvase
VTPLVLDVKTAAATLGVSVWMLRRYIDDGLLPTVKFPGRYDGEKTRRVLIAVSDLEAFVARHRTSEVNA